VAKKKTTRKKSAKKAPAKKSTSKSAKKATKASAKKQAAKKKATRKKTTKKKTAKKSTKKSASKKKSAGASEKKKTTKKKSTKKTTRSKSAAKKTTREKPAKTATKKTTKKTTKKKSAKKTSQKTTTQRRSRADAPAKPTEDQQLEQDMAKDWTVAQLKRVKTGLSKADLKEYLQLLLEKRAEIIGNVQGMEDARNAALGDIAHMPLHMADVGSDNYEQEFTLGLMESEREMLREIEEAIVRMREGYYGVCLESGRPIDRMRLEFAPWAKYCIAVARLREKRGW